MDTRQTQAAASGSQPLLYFDRYTQSLREEAIFGEKPLRWAYETRLGRLCLHGVFKRQWFSRLYGKWADTPWSAREIEPFIRNFGLDVTEFAESHEHFASFNEFFYRRLKPEARAVAAEGLCFPADGRHLYVPRLSSSGTLYAKGQALSLAELTGDPELAEQYAEGSAILSRLCPTDYHRFHFPDTGVPGQPQLINGSLYSVNPIALSRRIAYIWQNKRRLNRIRRPDGSEYLFLEIGATNVGSIVDTAEPHQLAAKGDEKGYFRFGGSMVITMFKADDFIPADDLAEQSARGVELYARMGDVMGRRASDQ